MNELISQRQEIQPIKYTAPFSHIYLQNELKNIKMSLKGGQADNNNASAALFDAIFEDPEAKDS